MFDSAAWDQPIPDSGAMQAIDPELKEAVSGSATFAICTSR